MTTDTLRQITGVLRTPEGSAFPNKTLTWFRERRVVQAQGSSVVLDEPFFVVTDAAGAIDHDVMAGNYLVLVRLKDMDRYFRVSVPDQAGPFNIADLVDAPPVTPEIITQVQALIIEARAWAQNPEGVEPNPGTYPDEFSARHWSEKARKWAETLEDTEVAAGQFSALHYAAKAAASAAQAALYEGVWLDDVAAVLSDTAMTYTAGTGGSVTAGDIVRTRAEGFSYEVAAAGASDHHVTTAGGVKLYARPGPTGAINVAALGVDDTGGTAVTTAVQSLIGFADEIVFPEGTYYCAINVTSPTTIRGAGEGRTIITTEALTNGTTITVSANLNLRDLTVKGHPTNASSKTISHTGAHTVIASNVTFTGTNHDPATGLSAAADYRHCTFHSGAQPNALGARCFSALGIFTDCVFSGGRTVEARDSKFFSCRIGDPASTNAVHIPDGATANDGNPNGYTGQCEFHDCIITSGGTGITEGNEGKAILRNCRIRCGLSVSGQAALYARSKSTFDAEGCDIFSGNNGTAVSFAKTVAQANGIGPSGESVLKRCRLEGAFTSLAVPPLAAAYPAADGNVRVVDCIIVGGDAEISPNTSTYHIFQTEQPLNYASTVIYASNGETKRFRFKQNKQLVVVYGSDAAKTGCFLSHLDEVTGLAHPDGMEIFVRYGGVSSRFVTFAQGATGDGGAMYFADAAATLATTQQGIYHFLLQGNTWRQCDG